MGIDGVVSAEVSYDDAVAVVRYLPERATPQQMIDAVDTAGFAASRLEDDGRDP